MTWWHNRFRAPQVKSYTDRLLEQIWSCIASLVVLSAILICGYDPWAVDPLFPALLLIGAGLFISGQVIRNRYMYYASCIVVPIGFGITRDSWLNADPDYNLLQFAAAILIGLTGAGYALRRQVRRDADEIKRRMTGKQRRRTTHRPHETQPHGPAPGSNMGLCYGRHDIAVYGRQATGSCCRRLPHNPPARIRNDRILRSTR